MANTDYVQHLAYQGTTGPLIELEHLTVNFQKNHVLNDISLSIPCGKTTAIVGPNGSGKSTLLKSLLGEYDHQGNIFIYWSDTKNQRIAYIPQYIDFDRELPMNSQDFLSMLFQKRPVFGNMHNHYRSITHHLFEKMGMLGHQHKKIGKLSGGELKRLLLAQALYPEPDLLLLDEPLTALDAPGTELFFSLLSDLQAMKKTIIWVEHNLMAVQQHAHHLIALNHNITHHGIPSDLSNPELYSKMFSCSSMVHEAPSN